MSNTASTPGPAAEPSKIAPAKRRGYLKWLALVLLGIPLCLGIALNPFHRGHFVCDKEVSNGAAIASALNQYLGQNGKYPEGNSSTEIFQKLLDGNFVSDPSLFYLPFPGKLRAVPGQPLKPENVSWDVTCWPDPDDFNYVPIIFITGCKVNYVPGGSAVPLASSLPGYHDEQLTLFQTWNHDAMLSTEGDLDLIYKGGASEGLKIGADGSFSPFISPDFNAHGKTYRQLTPDGPLR